MDPAGRGWGERGRLVFVGLWVCVYDGQAKQKDQKTRGKATFVKRTINRNM